MDLRKKLMFLGLSAMSLLAVPTVAEAHEVTFSMHHEKHCNVQVRIPEGWVKTEEKVIDKKGGFFTSGVHAYELHFKTFDNDRHCSIYCTQLDENRHVLSSQEEEFNKQILFGFHPHAKILDHSRPQARFSQTFKIHEGDHHYFVHLTTLFIDSFCFRICIRDHHNESSLRADTERFANSISLVPCY